MNNWILTGLGLSAFGALLISSCLPEDTRPPPATIHTQFALAPHADTELSDGLTVTTVDGYEITFERVVLSFGRVTFFGDDCNRYGGQAGFYSRVLDALQPGEQPLSLNYALGQCEMQFRLYPPEDWAHIDNAGISEEDLAELRAVEFSGDTGEDREEADGFSGPRGPQGASLRVVGTGHRLEGDDTPIPFVFEFGTGSFPPKCRPNGNEFFEFSGGDELSPVVEMYPEQIFGTCGDSTELRFAPVAAAQALVESGEPVTLATLEEVEISEFSEGDEQDFYTCTRFAGTEYEDLLESFTPVQPTELSLPNLRRWLQVQASYELFGVRDAECTWQPPRFEEQFQ